MTTTPQNNASSVAAIIASITAEHIAAQRALSAYREGTARHAFITRREENIGQHLETLATMIPRDAAMGLVVDALKRAENEDIRERPYKKARTDEDS
jgi:hypothetical protein